MRSDNVADYPWLCFALTRLMREYGRMADAGAVLKQWDENPAAFTKILIDLTA